ncbi:amidohydrolase family protein [Kribbella sandramycini]|uniref:Amidohydrolase family protein n=1 Tax=Kribbella sandramycini TaxID=60450 RepID=A0A7Y4KWW0_9ACTN|nr:amidohydrolase family protein [Kribbella sandramycini]MBB6569991.1 putative TIM-barrel fold metal-dependent hydrolase [Kribbella sandramycini]NOL40185.1 amidohydrolase family protein [Kribbella sandramycini]
MLIDVHAHWGPWFFSMEVGPIEVNSELLDRFGIDLQLVSSIEAIVYDAPAGNRALDEQLGVDDRLRGMVVVDPRRLEEARADLTRLAGDVRWVGAKIHSEYSRTPIAAPAMQAAIELTTEFGLPTLVHTWGDTVLDLADVAARVPGARVLAGHMGAAGWPLVPEAAGRSDRIWFEPCWSAPEAGRIRWILDRIGPDRLMFGTDATLIDPSVALGALEAADLTPAEADAVRWGNAVGLFGL